MPRGRAVSVSVLFSLFLFSGCSSTPQPRGLSSHVEICADLFAHLFHNVSRTNNTTTLRKELKVVVTKPIADQFFADVGRILETGPSGSIIELRDVLLDPNRYAVTHTDYLPPFVGMRDGKKIFKAQIRLRRYLLVPNEVRVADIDSPQSFTNVRLTDTEGNFVRLEFKVGHPEMGTDGKLKEMDSVVDKPGLIIDRDDVNLLAASPENFRAHRDNVAARTKALTITRRGRKVPVNVPEEVDAILDRLGQMHTAGYTQDLVPEMNVSYARTGFRITFPYPESLQPPRPPEAPPKTFEVQITVDKHVNITDFADGSKMRLLPTDRVVEMKIPVDFATKTNEELMALGLVELAQIRQTYNDLPPREGTRRGSGKRKQIAPPPLLAIPVPSPPGTESLPP